MASTDVSWGSERIRRELLELGFALPNEPSRNTRNPCDLAMVAARQG